MAVLVAAVALLVLWSPALPRERPVPVAAAGGPHWVSCAEADLQQAGAQCATVSVPLDYSDPRGTRLTLAISRVRHDVPAAQYLGVMLTNPGGPGASGLSLALTGAAVPGGVGGRYDWIGIDPRGVGASRPRLTCGATSAVVARPDYRATTPALQSYWVHQSQKFAQACARNDLLLLQHMTFEDTARDLDAVRAALGVPTISYYGFDTGAYLGEVYATLFPQRLHRMVLDSTVDPHLLGYESQFAQDVAFQRALRRFFGWVAHHDATYHLGSTANAVQRNYTAELNALARRPVGGRIGPDELTDAVADAGYYQSYWPYVAQAWDAVARHRSIGPLVRLGTTTGGDNESAVYSAVRCTDGAWPRDYATWRAAAVATSRQAPLTTWDNVWYNAPCLFWPVPPADPVVLRLAAAPPTLLVAETFDAASPFAGSLAVRAVFPAARLLSIPRGVNHASSLQGNGCEDDVIAGYLATGALPGRQAGSRADLTCPALPGPRPLS